MTTERTEQLERICLELMDRGLGELLMVARYHDNIVLGNLVRDKGTSVVRDRGLLSQLTPEQVSRCWDIGIVGVVCDLPQQEWRSLTLLGLNSCKFPAEIAEARERHKAMLQLPPVPLATFCGSVYRGMRMMMDCQMVPVVLPLCIDNTQGLTGLAICDFKMADRPGRDCSIVNQHVRHTIENPVMLNVEDVEVGNAEFLELFGAFIKDD
ncbi:MAG: hypothetical protein H6978_10990 [Gammaproteobacteria bacterium]|nr:hypothetical protein [Gammaproteobacteria bacterium]